MSKVELYDNVHTLPVGRYWRAVFEGDMRSLVVSGEPSDEQLLEAYKSVDEQVLGIRLKSRSFQKRIKEMKAEALSKCGVVLQNNVAERHRLQVEEEKKEQQSAAPLDFNLYRELHVIEQTLNLRAPIDPEQCSTARFFEYRNMIDNGTR